MQTGIEKILRDGFDVWKNNKVIAVPFILKAVVQILLLVLFVLAFWFAFAGEIRPDRFVTSSGSFDSSSIGMLAIYLFAGALAYIILFILVSAYFDAGAIGMARKAVETGTASLGHMTRYGSKSVWSLFIAELLLFLMTVVPLLIILTGFFFFALASAASGSGAVSETFTNVIQFGLQAFVLIATIIAIVFAAAPFAVVLGRNDAIKGLEESYELLKKNKLPYLLLFVFNNYLDQYLSIAALLAGGIIFGAGMLFVPIDISALSSGNEMPIQVLQSMMQTLIPLGLVALVSLCVFVIALFFVLTVIIQPLNVIWWTMFYLDRSDEKRK